MRRILRLATMALLALVLVSFAAAGTAAASTSTARPAATAAACSGELAITQSAFSPATVAPGQSSTMNTTMVNCTAATISVNIVPYGIFQGTTSGTIPPGCPAIDPIELQATIAAGASYTSSSGYEVFSGCLATSLQGHITVYDGTTGATLATATPVLTITQAAPPNACQVAYTVQSQWHGGFTASIAITNGGTAAINGWTLVFVFGGDQKINNAWGASATQSGSTVTLTNASYDSTIAPGATTSSIGMIGTWTTSNAAPTGFTLSGIACSS